jgi:uncharacterized protein
MAKWDNIGSRGNVSDRRGSPLALGGMGIVGVGAVLLFTYLTGGDVLGTFMNMATTGQLGALQTEDTTQYEGEDSYELFVSNVLGSTDDFWRNEFTQAGRTYTPPELVLFRGGTQSACGGASAMVGPHYCPLDGKIYLDETFFNELETRLGADGGDVAEAYVIAHEVGHHVQNELGLLGEQESNQASVATELQADCLAGAWLGSLKDAGVLEEGEIREALDAASSVGDDNIQKRTQGEVQPESWTHGSSEQRSTAFNDGYAGANMESCVR